MYTIQANPSGTRTISVEDSHLETIQKYELLDGLVNSTGIIDEETLGKLRLTLRSILEMQDIVDKDLLALSLDVIYHNDMKALGLKGLIELYKYWLTKK
ncbi:MAG: hypothetical protein PUF62_10420 [Bacteroidales bacterium]|nr:hypothetical protein [Bacteroidales bacterium]